MELNEERYFRTSELCLSKSTCFDRSPFGKQLTVCCCRSSRSHRSQNFISIFWRENACDHFAVKPISMQAALSRLLRDHTALSRSGRYSSAATRVTMLVGINPGVAPGGKTSILVSGRCSCPRIAGEVRRRFQVHNGWLRVVTKTQGHKYFLPRAVR